MEHSQPSGSSGGQTPGPASAISQENGPLHPSGNVVTLPQQEAQVNRAGAVITQIEAIFESMFDDLSTGANHLSIPYRSRTSNRHSGARRAGRGSGALTFPGKTPQEAKKFSRSSNLGLSLQSSLLTRRDLRYFPASLLRILQISREALVTGSVISKRFVMFFLLYSLCVHVSEQF
jgi:hypothetical protein